MKTLSLAEKQPPQKKNPPGAESKDKRKTGQNIAINKQRLVFLTHNSS